MRAPELRLFRDELIVDNFAGGGGASLGIEWALGRSPDLAVNHDAEALAMHAANHPLTRHLCENVWAVDPVEVCGGRRVGLAWFSPDCTHHSKARGGVPFRDPNKARRSRGLAWVVRRWAKAVKPRVIILENVEEFADWGPIGDDGRADPERAGFTFRRWWGSIIAAGYHGEMRELRACDYGAPTTRKRLFIIFRSDGEPINWPEPTHGPGLQPYATAAQCIDWSLPCPSIFLSPEEARALGVRRPLAENTLRRIARGVQRYVIEAAEPFIVPITHVGDVRVHGINEPIRTVTTAARGELALIAPTLINTRNGERQGQAPRVRDILDPMPTVTAQGSQGALVAAFLAQHNTGMVGHDARRPLSTTVSKIGPQAVVTSHLLKLRGGLADHVVTSQGFEQPAPTVTANGNHLAEVRAFLLKYYGQDQDPRLDEPMHTVTTRDHFALVTVVVAGVEYVLVDIGMRMLTPRELFRAQGFPDSYRIDPSEPPLARQLRLWCDQVRRPLTKTAQVKCCGNSVSPVLAAALARAQFVRSAGARQATG